MVSCSIKTLAIAIFSIIYNPRTSHLKPSVIPFKTSKTNPGVILLHQPHYVIFWWDKKPYTEIEPCAKDSTTNNNLKTLQNPNNFARTLKIQHCKSFIHLTINNKIGRKVVKVEVIVIVGTMMYII